MNRRPTWRAGAAPVASGPAGEVGRRTDEGFAFLVAVIVIALVMALIAATLMGTVIDNVTTASQNVQQAQALQAAHAGLNVTYERIHTEAVAATEPCGKPATPSYPGIQGTLGSAPSTSSYAVRIDYFSTATAQTPLTCAQVRSGSLPAAVELYSVGTDLGQKEEMASEADLSFASTGSLFGDTIFVTSTLTLTGADTFTGTAYIHGNLTCSAGGVFDGTYVVTGTTTLKGNCHVDGNVVSVGTLNVPRHSSVGVTGIMESTGGAITIGRGTPTGLSSATKTLEASGSISYPSYWHPLTKGYTITPNDTSLTAPQTQTMPALVWTKAGWEARGYTATVDDTCGTGTGGIYAKLAALATPAATAGKPLALYTTCEVVLHNRTVDLSRSLALFSTKGMLLTANGDFLRQGTATPDLYLVVPTDTSTGAPVSCTGTNGNITMHRTATIGTDVTTLLFTPCTVTMIENTHVTDGQVYAGHLIAHNGMSFAAPPTPPGASGGGSVAGTATVGIVYERQVTPPT